jgi:hypothetical protein
MSPSLLAPRRLIPALTLGATAAVLAGALGMKLAEGLPGQAGESARVASQLVAGIAGLTVGGGFLLARVGRSGPGLTLLGTGALVVAAWLALVAARMPAGPRVGLLPGDRAGLVLVELEGARWAAHPTLGFRLPQPALALVPAPELVEETALRAGPSWAEAHQLWAFEAEDRSVTVTLDLTAVPAVRPEDLVSHAEVAAGALGAAARTEDGAGIRVDPLRMRAEECGVAGFGGALEGGGRVDGRVLGFRAPGHRQDAPRGRAFHLVVTVVGPSGAGPGDFLDGIVVPCAGR